MNLLDEFSLATTRLNSLDTRSQKLKEKRSTKTREINDFYSDKIYALQKEQRDKVGEIELETEKQLATLEKEKEQYQITIDKVNRIFKLMYIYENNEEKKEPHVYYYSNWDEQNNYISNKRKILIPPVKTLIDDNYNAIALYIVPNKKPVKKFSLIIRGWSLFSELFSKNYRGCVTGIHEEHCNLSYVVTDGEEMNYLLGYMNRDRNQKKIFNLLPKELNDVAIEYEEAIELMKQTQWQIIYLESRKYYYEHHYSRGTETEEYAAIVKKLNLLKKK